MSNQIDWSAVFNEVFSSDPSEVQDQVWRESFGDEYPDEVQPYSYITRSELAQFVEELDIESHSTVLDIGCGRGGPGLWVAAMTGASIIGVDISTSALSSARERAARLGLAARAEYVLGDFASIPVPSGSVEALMSVDALLFAPDKRSAIVEIFRVLKPGGRFVATSWDYHSQPHGRPPQVPDHRPLLVEAGFEILRYDETNNWRHYMEKTNELMLQRVADLAMEDGSNEDELRASLIEMDETYATMTQRVLIVAQKPEASQV
jgi:ubiquinone/menaquinone biosynthesis C-methylase UbiE